MKGQFSFYFSFLNNAYSADYMGQDKRISFPAEYDGKPVAEIDHVSGGFLPGDACPVAQIEIPASVRVIGERAFAGLSLKKLVFRDVSGWTTEGVAVPEETLKDAAEAAKFYADHTKRWNKTSL